MNVWQSVKAKNPHPRGGDAQGNGGQAGCVVAVDPAKSEVVVKWDEDGVTEAVSTDLLQAL